MKREDFKEIGSNFIISCKKIQEYDSCVEGEEAIKCIDCPFYIKNMNIDGDFVCYIADKNKATSAKEFLQMCKTEGILHEDGSIPEEDRIKSPNHYKLEGLNVESKDVAFAVIKNIKNQKIAVCIFNVLKYVIRTEKKNGLEDYKKAQEYLSWAIEEREVEENGNRENRTEKI